MSHQKLLKKQKRLLAKQAVPETKTTVLGRSFKKGMVPQLGLGQNLPEDLYSGYTIADMEKNVLNIAVGVK